MALRNSAQERGLIAALGVPSLLEGLFNHLPNVVFFVKDREGRYVLVNETLLRRCGIASKNELLGRTAEEVFPSPLGASYTAQDRLVLETGAQIRNKLELHLYPGRKQGWCLTFKTPLHDATGTINGLVGISRDLPAADARRIEYRQLADAVEYLKGHYTEPLRLEELARVVGLAMDRFERLVREVFDLTPRQLLTQTRIQAASRLLRRPGTTVSEVAHHCGYSDHSAFTRQFKSTVGLTPREFRLAAKEITDRF